MNFSKPTYRCIFGPTISQLSGPPNADMLKSNRDTYPKNQRGVGGSPCSDKSTISHMFGFCVQGLEKTKHVD